MASKQKLTSEQEAYLIRKYAGTSGGLKPRNVEVELEDGYEFGEHQFGGITIKKKNNGKSSTDIQELSKR